MRNHNLRIIVPLAMMVGLAACKTTENAAETSSVVVQKTDGNGNLLQGATVYIQDGNQISRFFCAEKVIATDINLDDLATLAKSCLLQRSEKGQVTVEAFKTALKTAYLSKVADPKGELNSGETAVLNNMVANLKPGAKLVVKASTAEQPALDIIASRFGQIFDAAYDGKTVKSDVDSMVTEQAPAMKKAGLGLAGGPQPLGRVQFQAGGTSQVVVKGTGITSNQIRFALGSVPGNNCQAQITGIVGVWAETSAGKVQIPVNPMQAASNTYIVNNNVPINVYAVVFSVRNGLWGRLQMCDLAVTVEDTSNSNPGGTAGGTIGGTAGGNAGGTAGGNAGGTAGGNAGGTAGGNAGGAAGGTVSGAAGGTPNGGGLATRDARMKSLMTSRSHRMWHYLWHGIRNAWARMSPSERQSVRQYFGSGWGRNDAETPTTPQPDHGEEFLHMHREMIGKLVAVLGSDMYRPWTEPPAPSDANYPVPAGNSFVSNNEYRQLAAWNQQALSTQTMRGMTLGAYGDWIELNIHNMMHTHWTDPRTANPQVMAGGIFDQPRPEWDDPSQDNLASPYSSHVNPLFWRIHGYVDARLDAWLSANGYTSVSMNCQGQQGCYQWRRTWTGTIPPSPSPTVASGSASAPVAASAAMPTGHHDLGFDPAILASVPKSLGRLIADNANMLVTPPPAATK